MSKKDFDKYYQTLCDQYVQLREELDVFQKMLGEKMIEPERLEVLKKTFQPIMDSYQMVSWVAFLLNTPSKKDKKQKYQKMMSKKIKKLDPAFNQDSVIQKNEDVLENIHKQNESGDK